MAKEQLYTISKFILFFLDVLYGMFGIIVFGLATWIIADYYQGTYVSWLRLSEVQVGAALLLTTGIFLFCTSIIGCFAMGQKNPNLMTAFFACIIITCIISLAGAAYTFSRTKSIQETIDYHIDRMVREYDNRGPEQDQAATFMDMIQKHLFCCGGESANDYRIRDVPESCKRPWLSGMSQVWGCKEVAKRWLDYNLDAVAGIGIFICIILSFGALASWIMRGHYIQEKEGKVTTNAY
ncbi:23 kDa integral membrane protein-like [Paramacrobiotus metropolitanus]|uniref:23 kDa integral membrane protein-like n=1 Tax=Paramacrobiotus metropolitanus TaxID=2943436 RepID=UPI0024462AA2|nr:23 kDa integral membrane protein-like [Paramacrobiotus metropolitanus]